MQNVFICIILLNMAIEASKSTWFTSPAKILPTS